MTYECSAKNPRSYLLPSMTLVFLLFVGLSFGQLINEEAPSLGEEAFTVIEKGSSKKEHSSNSIASLRRVLACQRLARDKSDGSIQRLSRLSRDSSPLVRAHALTSLGEFKAKEAKESILAALNAKDWRSRRCAIEALGKLRDSSCNEALQRALDDESQWVRLAALRALNSGV